MGQKSNLLTLRKSRVNANLLTTNPKEFVLGLKFLTNLNQLFSKKKVILAKKDLNFESNKLALNLSLFFRTSKLIGYQKIKKSFKTTNNDFDASFLQPLVKNHFSILKNNNIQLSVVNLNHMVKTSEMVSFFNKLRRFSTTLFARRFNLFLDFLKFSCLFEGKKVDSKIFLGLIGEIFRVLPKRKHNIFIIFLKTAFSILVKRGKVCGLRLLINGRLKGKPRSNSMSILVGSAPVQSLSKDIEFSKLHVYTLNGAFGFKFWVYR